MDERLIIDQAFADRCEARHTESIDKIANEIKERGPKVVLIAGPSSSGKTTFARRLSQVLEQKGMKPYPISLDDYFMTRDRVPKDDKGNPDFETVYSLDIDLFKRQLEQLFNGEEVELPTYNFLKGAPEYATGRMLRMTDGMVLVIEGLHGLNPILTDTLRARDKYLIYIAPEDTEIISGTDRRMLRRTIRDVKTRGTNAERTLQMWPAVCNGEHQWINPFRKDADAHFDSHLDYELVLVKPQAIDAFAAVPPASDMYPQAQKILARLSLVPDVPDIDVPENSLLREFI